MYEPTIETVVVTEIPFDTSTSVGLQSSQVTALCGDAPELYRGMAGAGFIAASEPKKPSARQDIGMQVDRLTKLIDSLYNTADSNLGKRHQITKQALAVQLYFHGFKLDLSAKEE